MPSWFAGDQAADGVFREGRRHACGRDGARAAADHHGRPCWRHPHAHMMPFAAGHQTTSFGDKLLQDALGCHRDRLSRMTCFVHGAAPKSSPFDFRDVWLLPPALAAAYLDVFNPEPLGRDSPFWGRGDVHITLALAASWCRGRVPRAWLATSVHVYDRGSAPGPGQLRLFALSCTVVL